MKQWFENTLNGALQLPVTFTADHLFVYMLNNVCL